MNRRLEWSFLLAALLLLRSGAIKAAWADHEEHKEKRRDERIFARDDDDDHDRKHSEDHTKAHLNPVNNDTYKEVCGACHFAYQPELLPSGSWEKILAGLPDHFG